MEFITKNTYQTLQQQTCERHPENYCFMTTWRWNELRRKSCDILSHLSLVAAAREDNPKANLLLCHLQNTQRSSSSSRSSRRRRRRRSSSSSNGTHLQIVKGSFFVDTRYKEPGNCIVSFSNSNQNKSSRLQATALNLTLELLKITETILFSATLFTALNNTFRKRFPMASGQEWIPNGTSTHAFTHPSWCWLESHGHLSIRDSEDPLSILNKRWITESKQVLAQCTREEEKSKGKKKRALTKHPLLLTTKDPIAHQLSGSY